MGQALELTTPGLMLFESELQVPRWVEASVVMADRVMSQVLAHIAMMPNREEDQSLVRKRAVKAQRRMVLAQAHTHRLDSWDAMDQVKESPLE